MNFHWKEPCGVAELSVTRKNCFISNRLEIFVSIALLKNSVNLKETPLLKFFLLTCWPASAHLLKLYFRDQFKSVWEISNSWYRSDVLYGTFCCISSFVPNAALMYPLKTSENLMAFWCFQGIEKGRIGNNELYGFESGEGFFKYRLSRQTLNAINGWMLTSGLLKCTTFFLFYLIWVLTSLVFVQSSISSN